jgi:uroporphyrin-III C-methyltransferase / precorrin-2 dehydrogenase / sirohydrochlorin ferrochelatase
MQHFPIFVDLRDRRVVVCGGGEEALAKLRLLLKTEARVEVYAEKVGQGVRRLADEGRVTLHAREVEAGDLDGTALAYGATGTHEGDARLAWLSRAARVPFNLVDNLEDSAFITPAIVDRDPVVVAIGTEGAAPVLARAVKEEVEARLPSSLGLLARVGKAFRGAAEALPMGRARRAFWAEYYDRVGPEAAREGEAAVAPALARLLTRHLDAKPEQGRVDFVGAGPGDPELLTLRARRILDRADVVIHDRLVTPAILDLARREALMVDAGKEGFGPSTAQADIDAMIVRHALKGRHVVRLKSGDPTVFGRLDEEIAACEAAGVAYAVVPGITAASAAVASIGQSLTKRGRNASVRFVTGHDAQGFAEHDWKALARPGEVLAIYMGKKTARFVQGRLLMHGADPMTPVTAIENASRPDQRVVATTIGRLEPDLSAADLRGAAIILIGLAPRQAAEAVHELQEAL